MNHLRFSLCLATALLFAGLCVRAQQPSVETVPIQVASGLVYMEGNVGRSGPLSVVLDTGSSVNIVSPSVANAAGLTSTGNTKAAGIGTGADETLRMVKSADLKWGTTPTELQLTGQKCAILPIDYISKQIGKHTDAIFGSSLFLSHIITVDYVRMTATFASSDAGSEIKGTPIPIKIFGSVPFIDATLEGPGGTKVSGLFFVDSGTTSALILSKKFLDAHPKLLVGARFAATPSVTAVGGTIRSSRIKLPALTVGPFVLSNLVAAVPDSAVGVLANPLIAGMIGADVLRRFTVTWDYARKQMFLQPNKTLSKPFETDASGVHLIAPAPDYQSTKIESVLSGSPAAQAGLLGGDQIVAVNGSTGLPLWKIAEALQRAGTTARLKVKRNGRVLTKVVRLRSPFSDPA